MKKPAGLILAALFFGLPASAQTQREVWNGPTDPFRIADDLYYVGTAGLASYLFVSPDGHILLDGALEESVPEIEANIRELGFELRDIRYLLNSHAHLDHSGGLARLKADTGARLLAHEGDRSALEGGFYLGSESVKALGAPPVSVDLAFEDGQVVELGGWELVAHHTPGHSRGCTSWGFDAGDGGQSFSALVFCSASVAANRITAPVQYADIVADYRKTFAKAETMKIDMFLAPHPEFFGMAAKRARMAADSTKNAFADPAEFPVFIARQKADFEKQLAERMAAAKPAN
ncbi:MAG: subclass B3 metallo-beta-lactamase [Alphaproteobacteria bacterium]|nr:subclass B3 metallo-beta-lactamase [Alphaproteobacteria bacterium]